MTLKAKVNYLTALLVVLLSVVLWMGTGSARDREVYIEVPLGLPEVVALKDNPPTMAKIELGKMLYFDPRLSLSGTLSCATCHDPNLGYSNGAPFAVGHQHAVGGRNAPTVLNAAFATTQFWDGRAPSLEEQAGGPMTAGVEMAGIPDEIVQTLAKIPEYRELSMAAFGEYLSFCNIRKAIATFERTILAGNSPFDKYYYGKDKGALSGAALRGKEVFDNPNKGNCKKCHTYTKTDGYFSDNQFHNVGIGYDKKLKKGENYDLGRYDVTKKKEDKGRFRTPTLRNIVQTAPYFHDGRTFSLEEAAVLCLNGIPNDNLDPEYKVKRKLSKQELSDLVEFMKALTGELPIFAKPAIPGI
jgi:cytochrome c peroxidase